MKETRLQKIDEQIAEHLLVVSFYEMMSRFIVSLGSAPLPSTYAHPIVNVLGMLGDNATLSKGVTKGMRGKLEKLVKGSKVDRYKLTAELDTLKDKSKSKVEKLIMKRLA